MHWDQIVKKVTAYVVKIETPLGHGTGFLCFYNESKAWCGIATATHVVEYADQWHQPIRIKDNTSTEIAFLSDKERVILTDWLADSAVILLPNVDLKLPESLIQLLPTDGTISIGTEVGWLGFPAIEPNTLCFFSGNVSARQTFRNAYLIDGVAISGVSGGPVFYATEPDGIQIIGVVSAYRPNRTAQDTLPGLLIAQDLSRFHEVINHIRSLDEARRKKQELQQTNPPPDTGIQPDLIG
jgi:hypothetical protein